MSRHDLWGILRMLAVVLFLLAGLGMLALEATGVARQLERPFAVLRWRLAPPMYGVRARLGPLSRAERAMANGDDAEAIRVLGNAAYRFRRAPEPWRRLAVLLGDRGDVTTAINMLEFEVRTSDNARPLRELGALWLLRARQERARGADAEADSSVDAATDAFRRALAADPTDRWSAGYLACLRQQTGDTVSATILLHRAGPGPWESCR